MRLYSIVRAIPALVVWAAVASCSDDNGGALTAGPETIQGSWIATSFVVGGVDAIALGMGMSMFFEADGEYSFLVSNDMLDMCDIGTTCEDVGTYTATSSTITFDPGEDPVVFTYSITGNVMSLSGSMEGAPVTATFERG